MCSCPPSFPAVFSPADMRYIAIHEAAASRAYEAAADLMAAAERLYRAEDWELAAQAEEEALGL